MGSLQLGSLPPHRGPLKHTGLCRSHPGFLRLHTRGAAGAGSSRLVRAYCVRLFPTPRSSMTSRGWLGIGHGGVCPPWKLANVVSRGSVSPLTFTHHCPCRSSVPEATLGRLSFLSPSIHPAPSGPCCLSPCRRRRAFSFSFLSPSGSILAKTKNNPPDLQ